MKAFREAEIQVLIAALELTEARKTLTTENVDEAKAYFGRSLVDWSGAFASLAGRGLLSRHSQTPTLTAQGGAAAALLHQARYLYHVAFSCASPDSTY